MCFLSLESSVGGTPISSLAEMFLYVMCLPLDTFLQSILGHIFVKIYKQILDLSLGGSEGEVRLILSTIKGIDIVLG